MCKTAAQYLAWTEENITVEIHELFETQWEQYMRDLKKSHKFYSHKGSYIVFINDTEYLGVADQFMTWALVNYRY